MSCGKACEKLWNNYLNKYGDFRERSRLIRDDRECFKQFQLPRLTQRARKSPQEISHPRIPKECDPSLPIECCSSLKNKKHLLFTWNKNELDQLEKIIEAENFPDNIFPAKIDSRPSVVDEINGSFTDGSQLMTSSLNSLLSTSSIQRSIIASGKQSSIPRAVEKSELIANAHDLTANQVKNPYRQFLERFCEPKKIKSSVAHLLSDSTINPHIQQHIQKFLSFLQSLDDQSVLDEHTLVNLFSVDNHLSSSMYIPTQIQRLNVVPKSIRQSLKSTPEDKRILNKLREEKPPQRTKPSLHPIYENHIPTFTDQDAELHARLLNSSIIREFKEFLLHRNKSARLPKLFADLKPNSISDP